MEKDTLQKLKEDIKYEILTELGLWLNSENALKTHGTINERIRNLRKMKGINQEMMARNIGMNRTTYARYEEKGNYAIDDIFKIADYLNISAEYIIFGITAEKTTHQKDAAVLLLEKDEEELLNCIYAIPKPKRNEVMKKINNLALKCTSEILK